MYKNLTAGTEMFGLLSKLKTIFDPKKKVKIMIIGLDHSGKTTIVEQIKSSQFSQDPPETIPTVGFQVEQFSRDRLQFTVFDMSGQGRYRDIWSHYYSETDAIIFVLDASDKTRLCVVKDELNHLFRHPSIAKSRTKRKLPILFFFNKIDIEGSMGLEECKIASGLLEWEQNQKQIEDSKKTTFEWKFQPCQATVGKGLSEGFSWLSEKLNEILK